VVLNPDVKPVFVSTGHRMDLETACSLTLRLTPRFRLPETTRAADRACRDAVAAL
jgi:deoxyribonuclease V